MTLRSLVIFAASVFAFVSRAQALEGLVASDLPVGGNVTVPGDYPITIPKSIDITLSNLTAPQAITLTNSGLQSSTVKIFANDENGVRTVTLRPGMSVVYSFRKLRAIRIRPENSAIRLSSIHPIKIQR